MRGKYIYIKMTIHEANAQKQQPEVFYKKRCSEKFCQIRRKTPFSESLF